MRVREWFTTAAIASLLAGVAACSGPAQSTPPSVSPSGSVVQDTPSSDATEPSTSPSDDAVQSTLPVDSVAIPHIQSDWGANGRTIRPTAIVLHWWAGWGGGRDINRLVSDSNHNMSTYNPDLKSTDPHPTVGHVTEQFGVLGDGAAYQLTPLPNTWARHAKCANSWAIGIEIEGSDQSSAHYIGNNQEQFDTVVKLVKELMAEYNIKAVSVVASDGRSGSGIVSHKMVDAKCKWADDVYAGSGKSDVDDVYLARVISAVK